MLTYYVVSTAVLLGILGSIWTTRHWFNRILKFVLLGLAVVGSVLSFRLLGL
jgi:hypothetical protein